MSFSPKYLIKILEQQGFEFKRSTGSHRLYHNPETKKTVIVPVHDGRDVKKGTFFAVLKQAGINKNEIE
jgi:predicted RNA binding protein YcfA (HicA-like mRNA interferase family)